MRLMKNMVALAALALFFSVGRSWSAPLKVVATTSDLADLARQVGGERVQVESLASPVQNPHFADAKPSLILKLMRADLFIQTGMELEIGWAPQLLQSAGNRKILPDTAGFLDASQAIEPIEVPHQVSRSGGDVHPAGNPHYMLDPENARLVARLIFKKFAELMPENVEEFRKNLNGFEARLDDGIKRWTAALAPHRGAKFVSYHRDSAYFARRFGLDAAGEIEPKPGIPPTAAHTAEVIKRMRADGVRLVLTQPWYESRTPAAIAKQAGAGVVELSMFPGARPETQDYLAMTEHNVKAVAQVLEKGAAPR